MQKVKKVVKTKLADNRLNFLLYAVPTILVMLFFGRYLFTGDALIGGDFDYIAQAYEAARISILKFGQFPDNNPWMAGGVPLFANPQYGLWSVQTLLTFIFGTVYGLKLAYIFYALIGFWGMYTLCTKVFKASYAKSLLISFIWISCGFFSALGGHGIVHFTFSSFFLFPWIIFALETWKNKFSWLILAIAYIIISLTSVHYALLMTGLVAIVYALSILFSIYYMNRENKPQVKTEIIKFIIFGIKALALFVLLAGPRIAATYSYAAANERKMDGIEVYPTVKIMLQAIFTPTPSIFPQPSNIQWGWAEYNMYIGLGAGILFFTCLVIWLFSKNKTNIFQKRHAIFFIALILFFFIMSLGDFGRFSPFNIIQHLPGFSQSRVPSRWAIFCVFFILLFIANFKIKQKLSVTLLSFAVIELFMLYGPFVTAYVMYTPKNLSFSDTFQEFDNGMKHTDATPVYDKNSYFVATSRNTGQVYADDSLVNTLNQFAPTNRCGINTNPNCDLVLSDNADIVKWSPNEIEFKRTAPGVITLNMNRYYAWTIDGKRLFPDDRRVNTTDPFSFNSNKTEFTIKYEPNYSAPRLMRKFLKH